MLFLFKIFQKLWSSLLNALIDLAMNLTVRNVLLNSNLGLPRFEVFLGV